MQKSKEGMKVWKNHFESLMNVSVEEIAKVKSMKVQIGVGMPHPHGEVERSEAERTVKELKTRKAPGIDGITAQMLNYGGDAVLVDVMNL